MLAILEQFHGKQLSLEVRAGFAESEGVELAQHPREAQGQVDFLCCGSASDINAHNFQPKQP